MLLADSDLIGLAARGNSNRPLQSELMEDMKQDRLATKVKEEEPKD